MLAINNPHNRNVASLYNCKNKIANPNNITNNKNQSTNIREPIVQIMSIILLSHWYMKVHITRMARIMEMIRGINLESFPKIINNLHIT